jgi:hypothetical protein
MCCARKTFIRTWQKDRMDTDSALATGVASSVAIIIVLCLAHTWYRALQRRPMSESDVSLQDVHSITM